jgi:serine/threonine protein kinase
MGETYLAIKRGPGNFEQHVCLKRIRSDFAGDPEAVRQFEAEARIAALLRHGTIAQVLDFGKDGDDHFLALELVDGLDLAGLLERTGPLPPPLLLHLALELSTALDFAHDSRDGSGAPVVHRDVSPSNVLISREGEVKLTDFGIARPLDGPSHTRTGVVKGKVPYMAPEYAHTGRYDPRCDLYSLGVSLFEVACGVRPYDGQTDLDTLARASAGGHEPLQALSPELPAELVWIIERLIQPDPEERFATAAAVLSALEALPAPPRARRELAARVRSAMGDSATETVPPESPEALAPMQDATSPQAPGPTRTRIATPIGPKPRRSTTARAALAGALAAAASVGAFALVRMKPAGPDSDSVTDSAPDSASASASVTDPAPAPDAASASASVTDPASDPASDSETVTGGDGVVVRPEQHPRPTPHPMRRARLQVAVVPFGDVYVDGRHVGASPVTLKLKPGVHRVEARTDSGSTRRRVELDPGEHRNLVLR